MVSINRHMLDLFYSYTSQASPTPGVVDRNEAYALTEEAERENQPGCCNFGGSTKGTRSLDALFDAYSDNFTPGAKSVIDVWLSEHRTVYVTNAPSIPWYRRWFGGDRYRYERDNWRNRSYHGDRNDRYGRPDRPGRNDHPRAEPPIGRLDDYPRAVGSDILPPSGSSTPPTPSTPSRPWAEPPRHRVDEDRGGSSDGRHA